MRRWFEILPATLAWTTLVLMVVFSWRLPAFIAIFIILFDTYWLLKSVYLSLHLRATFKIMRANLKINWLEKLEHDTNIRIHPNATNNYAEISNNNGANSKRLPQILEKELSYKLNGVFFRIHNKLGRFCRERQYADALVNELRLAGLQFQREVYLTLAGRKSSNLADFIVEGKVIVELKAKPVIDKDDYYQLQRYLRSADMQLGLLVNFREKFLKPKRVINSHYSQNSHTFVDRYRGTWREIYHLVILPMYNEPYALVRESFASLNASDYPKERLLVVLALEARGGAAAQEVGEKIKREFAGRFGKFLVTTHPAGIAGEIPGKGSNDTYAARQAKALLIDPAGIDYKRVMVSVFDIDTQAPAGYFSRLTHACLTVADPLHCVYQPIPIFTNNIFQAPALARVVSFSSTFWQMMQQSRPERLTTFSSQSLPLSVLLDIGFWHTDVVSEDSRVFWQGYLHYHGNFRAEPLFYPVFMDANVTTTFWGTMRNIYKQHRRWGWGVENIPYMLEGFRRDPTIPRRKKWYWTFNVLEGFHSWATNSLMIFALSWLPLLLGGRQFKDLLLAYSLPRVTRWIINLSMVGIATSAILSILLLPPKPKEFRRWHYLMYVLQWALIPVTLIVFGAIPGLEAQTRLALGGKWRLGFWVTPKGRYPETGTGVG